MSITCKFGGTSLADADRIRNAMSIVNADPQRRYIVPSAPGKRNPQDKKITDLLIAWHHLVQDGLDPEQPAQIVSDRFTELRDELGVDVDIEGHIEDIKQAAQKAESPAFLISRGEYLNATLIAGLLGATLVDPSACIRFDAQGGLDTATYALLGDPLTGDGRVV